MQRLAIKHMVRLQERLQPKGLLPRGQLPRDLLLRELHRFEADLVEAVQLPLRHPK